MSRIVKVLLGTLVVVVVEVVLFFAAGVTSTEVSTHKVQLWTGTVGSTGSSTVTVAFSGGVGSTDTELSAQEFAASSGSSTVWGTDTGGELSNPSSTAPALPKLTPHGTGELYFGFSVTDNTASAGATPGFSYATTANNNVVAYDTNVSSAVQPTAKQSSSGVSGAVAVLITPTGSSTTRAPTVSAVGNLVTKTGNNTTTLAVSPRTGDLLVLAVRVASPTITASSLSGGGVNTWTPAEAPFTSYPSVGPGALSNILLFFMLIVVPLAVLALGVHALIRRRRSQATSRSALPNPN